MKRIFYFLFFLVAAQLQAQVVFQENFESKTAGLDLSTEGYLLSQADNYTGTVTAQVVKDGETMAAQLYADVNAGANMQIAKTIDVEPGKLYNYAIRAKGPFKRQLRVYTTQGELLQASADYKPATEAETAAWHHMDVGFVPGEGVSQVNIAFHHYWSGTILLDSIVVEQRVKQTSYYVSSSQGDDNNSGTINDPFKSLAKISSIALTPGDTVLFKSGDTFKGHFVVGGSGSSEKPVLITAYGQGEKPILTGQVGAAGGGDYAEAIRIQNQDNITIDGLEIQNERLVSRSGVNDTDAFGISIHNSSDKVMRNFLFKNLKVCNVYAAEPMLDRDSFDAIQVSGIRFTCAKNNTAGTEKNINGVEIKDSYFTDLQRLGIQFKHSGGADGVGNDSINRNMNIHIHHNEFDYLGGTGVLPNGTYNCLIENNIFDHPGATTDSRMPGRGSSIWNYNAINTIMQYNMVISTRGYLDSYGIHIDKYNTNTFVQYNYMVDCIGGFVEILAGSNNSVYRFNVSVNSGFRYGAGVSEWDAGSSTIYIYSDRWLEPQAAALQLCDSVYVYNNTVVMNSTEHILPDSTFQTTFNLDGKNMFVYNNIFSSTNGTKMGHLLTVVRANDTPLTIKNNLYEGDVNPDWIAYDTNPIEGASQFTGVGDDKLAYELTADSDAIDGGVAIPGPKVVNAGYGVFKNIPVYPEVDFYGNPIDLENGTPNIGACNVKYAKLDPVTSIEENEKTTAGWAVYPQLSASTLKIVSTQHISGQLKLSLANMKGQVLQSENYRNAASQRVFDMQVTPDLPTGIYVMKIEHNAKVYSRTVMIYNQ